MSAHWHFDPWTPWGAAFIVFSLACLVVGSMARPLSAAVCCVVAAALVTITSPLPFVPTFALLNIPASYGWVAPMLRASKIKPDSFLSMVLLAFSGMLGVFVDHWIPMAVGGVIAVAVSRKSKFNGHRPVLVIGVLPTLGELGVLMLAPQLLSY